MRTKKNKKIKPSSSLSVTKWGLGSSFNFPLFFFLLFFLSLELFVAPSPMADRVQIVIAHATQY